jgi:hypothetical protein
MERNCQHAKYFRGLKSMPVGSVAAGPYHDMDDERALLEHLPVTLARQVAKIDAIPDNSECRGSEDGRE